MNVTFTATDTDGAVIHVSTEHVASWHEACKLGMDRRNQLVGDGIRVSWRKA
jgi:spermidine synthase